MAQQATMWEDPVSAQKAPEIPLLTSDCDLLASRYGQSGQSHHYSKGKRVKGSCIGTSIYGQVVIDGLAIPIQLFIVPF